MAELQLIWWEEQSNWSDSVVLHSCQTRLRFGNDNVSVVNSCALVPVCISGHHVVVLFYITLNFTEVPITIDYGASQVTGGLFDQAMHLATCGEKGLDALKLEIVVEKNVDPLALAILPETSKPTAEPESHQQDELCQRQSLDQVSDHDTPETSLDSETGGWIRSRSGSQTIRGFWHQQHAQNLGNHRCSFWIGGPCELFKFLGHHAWAILQLGFLKESASSSFRQHCET